MLGQMYWRSFCRNGYSVTTDHWFQNQISLDYLAGVWSVHSILMYFRIDDIEDEIVREKLKIRKIGTELDGTFDDIFTKYWIERNIPMNNHW